MNFALTSTRSLSALAMAAALVAAPLAASAASGAAADGARQPHKSGHHFKRHQGHFAHQGAARAFRALNLTQDQKDQIFKIRHDQAPAFYEGKKALRAAHASLRESGRAENFDATKTKQAADALGQAQAQLALLRAETGAKIHAVLTPEQRQKLTDMRAHKRAGKPAKS